VSEIVADNIIEFIRQLLPERDEALEKLAAECKAEWIPLVQPEVGQFLQVLLQIKQASRILELGTGVVYSTILLAQALSWPGRITTIEIDPQRYERACANFRQHKVAEKITPLLGDANELLPTLEGDFDFIFVDAAKGQYPEFFNKLWPKLAPQGVLIMDNIFMNGWVADMYWPERRKKTMVVRLRQMLETLKEHPGLVTSVLPLGDGLTVSVRKQD